MIKLNDRARDGGPCRGEVWRFRGNFLTLASLEPRSGKRASETRISRRPSRRISSIVLARARAYAHTTESSEIYFYRGPLHREEAAPAPLARCEN
jgi:hypothetical protein